MQRVVKVEYIGKSSEIMADYNGKRYCFSKIKKVQTIPVEVYNHIQRTDSLHRDDLIPAYEEAGVDVKREDLSLKIENLEKQIAELKDENGDLKKQLKAKKNK